MKETFDLITKKELELTIGQTVQNILAIGRQISKKEKEKLLSQTGNLEKENGKLVKE